MVCIVMHVIVARLVVKLMLVEMVGRGELTTEPLPVPEALATEKLFLAFEDLLLSDLSHVSVCTKNTDDEI
jgi:hypothetical protein